MRTVILCMFCLPFMAFAQKEELKQWCRQLERDITGAQPLHLQYLMTVTGNSEVPGKESLLFDVYRSGNRYKAVMGDAQDVIRDGALTLVANHVQRTLTLASSGEEQAMDMSMISRWFALADSASNITRQKNEQLVTYTLYFPRDFLYSVVRYTFHLQQKTLVNLYAEFSPSYPEPYYSLEMAYKKWDRQWRPAQGFPDVQRYVTKAGARYQAQPEWKGYELYQ